MSHFTSKKVNRHVMVSAAIILSIIQPLRNWWSYILIPKTSLPFLVLLLTFSSFQTLRRPFLVESKYCFTNDESTQPRLPAKLLMYGVSKLSNAEYCRSHVIFSIYFRFPISDKLLLCSE